MKKYLILLFATGVAASAAGSAGAADPGAGETKALPCTACHGKNGVSVSADIPNLAAQKADYLVKQLNAFRDKKRENPLMNAIAAQLSDADIADLAAHFSRLPGPSAGDATSELFDAVAHTQVRFPADRSAFTRYTTINFPDRKQVRDYLANEAALAAARDGRPLPAGSYLLVEIYGAKSDAAGKPVVGPDGFFVKDKLAAYTAMEIGGGWGSAVPELLRNGDWNYAVFKGDGSLKEGVNYATCYACHKPLAGDSYVFSIEALGEKAKSMR